MYAGERASERGARIQCGAGMGGTRTCQRAPAVTVSTLTLLALSRIEWRAFTITTRRLYIYIRRNCAGTRGERTTVNFWIANWMIGERKYTQHGMYCNAVIVYIYSMYLKMFM